MNEQKKNSNWYIEYDYKVFDILNEVKFDRLIFSVARDFIHVEGPISHEYTEEDQKIPEWMKVVAQSISDVSNLMYNFFYVEEKLSGVAVLKSLFKRIHTLLKVEYEYGKFFFILSEEFRLVRIMASCLRFSRFLEAIVKEIRKEHGRFDQTLTDNMDQVFLFIQQKVKETLRKTQHLGDHSLNLILLDILSMVLKSLGNPTMTKILDRNKQKQIIDQIQRLNQLYEEFQAQKIQEKKKFQLNSVINLQLSDEDPQEKSNHDHNYHF